MAKTNRTKSSASGMSKASGAKASGAGTKTTRSPQSGGSSPAGNTGRGSSSRAASSRSRAAGSSGASGAARGKVPRRREIGTAVCFVLGVFSLIGYWNADGVFIGFFSGLVKGLFGSGFFATSPVLLWCAVILCFHRGRPVRFRVVSTLLLIVSIGSLVHLAACKLEYEISFAMLSKLWRDGRALEAGGAVSGTLAVVLSWLFAKVGAIIVFICFTLFLLLTALNKTIAGFVDAFKNRERIEYIPEPEPERAAAESRYRAPMTMKRRKQIDIPLDEDESEPPFGIKAESDPISELRKPRENFFKTAPRVKTPDQLVSEQSPAAKGQTPAYGQTGGAAGPASGAFGPGGGASGSGGVTDVSALSDAPVYVYDPQKSVFSGNIKREPDMNAAETSDQSDSGEKQAETEDINLDIPFMENRPVKSAIFGSVKSYEGPAGDNDAGYGAQGEGATGYGAQPADLQQAGARDAGSADRGGTDSQTHGVADDMSAKTTASGKADSSGARRPFDAQRYESADSTSSGGSSGSSDSSSGTGGSNAGANSSSAGSNPGDTGPALSSSNAAAQSGPETKYFFPPLELLSSGSPAARVDGSGEIRENSERLEAAFRSFGVNVNISNATRGPAVTRYEAELEAGIKLNKLTSLADDIALSLGKSGVRIAAMPNKISTVGIEVPNKNISTVHLRDILESKEFQNAESKLTFAIGMDISGEAIIGSISKLPHMLVAGTTGSGKSVCLNSIILSILYKATPEEVRFIMLDPKMVEFKVYNEIPHLLVPVVTDVKKASGALQWAVVEMMKRYKLFSETNARDIEGYNLIAKDSDERDALPQIVVVIDELADLMMMAAKEVEESICRVAQMGRAAGVHLIIATQSPRADVITGLMKANIPSRIALKVSSALESRIILDAGGNADKLVGNGDMLFAPVGTSKPFRVQGTWVSDEERERVVGYIKNRGESRYSEEVMGEIEKAAVEKQAGDKQKDEPDGSDYDELLPQAVDVIFETGQASVSMLQRRLKLGYSRAARIVDQMEQMGIVGQFEGSKPRALLITRDQWRQMQYVSGVAPQDSLFPDPVFSVSASDGAASGEDDNEE